MATADMHKTAFITDDANYFYRVMPFSLKNAGATYQRLMDKVFSHLTGHCVEVYVDDMVVKSQATINTLKTWRQCSPRCANITST